MQPEVPTALARTSAWEVADRVLNAWTFSLLLPASPAVFHDQDMPFKRSDASSRPRGQPLPATTTYRCYLPLTAATYRQAFRRLSGSLPDAQFQLHRDSPLGSSCCLMTLYGSSRRLALVLCGSLHHLTPRRGGRSVSAAPSSLPLFLHKAVVSRTLPKYFIRLPVMGIRFILSDLGTAPFRSCFRLIQPKINSSGLLPDITKRC